MNFLSKPFSLPTLLCIVVSLFLVESAFAVSIQLSGFVRDSKTNEVLIGANVWEISQNTGTATDNRGYFSIKVTTPCTLKVSYIGYGTRLISVNTSSDSLVVVRLTSGTNLSEVTVLGQRENKSEITRLSAKELMLVPTICPVSFADVCADISTVSANNIKRKTIVLFMICYSITINQLQRYIM